MRSAAAALMLCLLLPALSGHGNAEVNSQEIKDLDQLLQVVKEERGRRETLNRQREQAFLADRDRQRALVAQARETFEAQQRQNQPLVAATEANAGELARLEAKLAGLVAGMGDVAAAFNEFAGDFGAVLNQSLVGVQFPERSARLRALAEVDTQPGISEVETLWILVQEEMTEAARIARLVVPVVAPNGLTANHEVVRIGPFSAYSEAGFLRYVPETGELLALTRQPGAEYLTQMANFSRADQPLASAVIDPTSGGLLGMLGYTPSLRERIEQAGSIGLIILGLGALGLLLTLWRSAYLGTVYLKLRRQRRLIDRPSPDNPLGRVILAAQEATLDNGEMLQLKLDEAVLAEIPALERGSGLIKLLAAISPLLGLLGTVTGMIITFQAISLFGTGDPKLMAGGISQALITTVLGLVVAIPLLFGHSLVAALSRGMIQRLDEQSAGLLARNAEERNS